MISAKHYGIVAFILISFLSLAFVINETVKAANEHQFKSIIEDRATTIGTLGYNSGDGTFSNTKSLSRFVNHIGNHLTLYTSSGELVFTSLKQPLTFQEVQKDAFRLKGGHFQYITHLKDDKQVIGYLCLSGAVPDHQGLFILDFIIFLLGIIVIIVYLQVVRKFTRPLEEATKMAEALAMGNFKKRTYEENPFDVSGRLGRSLNELARNLEQTTLSYQEQKDRLRTLIENLGSSLIFIDEEGQINLVNKTFRQTFHVDTTEWFEKNYKDVITFKEIIHVIDETIMVESTLKREMVVYIHIEKKFFDVFSAPILDRKKRFRGVILVFHDITELKKLEQIRKDFVANVSHELKTPITSITGFTETLMDGALEDKDILNQFLSIIHKESLRLQELIHDLLELSKLEQEHFHINWQPVHLEQLLKDTVLILQEKANSKEITLKCDVEEDIEIMGDTARIRQVMINLISNAIAYTPAKGSVWLNLMDKEATVDFIVRDTGIGIAEEQIPRIFERFYRVDKARSRNSGGTGLGLAIVKHIVEAHGGAIEVKSKIGKGTTFIITFQKEAPNIKGKGD